MFGSILRALLAISAILAPISADAQRFRPGQPRTLQTGIRYLSGTLTAEQKAAATRVVTAANAYSARTTMAVAPTMGALGAGFGASTVPSVSRTSDNPTFQLLPTDARLRYTGPMRQPGGNVFNGLTGAWTSAAVLYDGGDGWRISFTATTRYVEWSINSNVLTNNAENMQIRVNGQWAQASDFVLYTTAAATPQYRRFDFGTVATRTFEFFFGSGGTPVGFNLDSGAVPSLPAVSAGEPISWIFGDSYTNGWSQPLIRNTVAQAFGEIMGVSDIVTFGRGGQGWALNVDGRNIAQRIALDISRVTPAPDIVYLYGSVNDASQSAATASANLATGIQTVQITYPNAIIVVFTGFRATNGNTDTAHFNANKAAAEAVADGRTFVVDSSGWPLVTNTGLLPNGQPNDSPDNTHAGPNQVAYLSGLMKAAVVSALTPRIAALDPIPANDNFQRRVAA